MKVLLFNPNIDAERKISALMKKFAIAVLRPATVEEAWQTLALHGSSVDLAIIHREGLNGNGTPGMELVQKIKADATQSDLPFILTTEKWTEAECAQHQETPQGANGYFRSPIEEDRFQAMVETILGGPLNSFTGQSVAVASPPQAPTAETGSIQLQVPVDDLKDPSKMFSFGDLQKPQEYSNAFMTGTGVSAAPPSAPPASAGAPPPPPVTKQEGTMRISLDLNAAESMQLESRNAEDRPPAMIEVPVNASSEEEKPSEAPSAAPSPGGGAIEFSLDASIPSGMSSLSMGMMSQAIPSQDGILASQASIMLPDAVKTDSPTPISEIPSQDTPPVPFSTEATPEPEDKDAARQMPYLFGKIEDASPAQAAAALAAFAQPVGDAVVPGGAAQSPDLETLKKYLLLREQDVAALSAQLRASREQVSLVEERHKTEQAKNSNLTQELEQHKSKLELFNEEKAQAIEALQSEANELRFQMRAKADKANSLEAQVKIAAEEVEQIKKRVRLDIRKIRTREKELENKLEILKKDSEALISSRESKIIELKRKLDLLEFNMDLLQDQYMREKELTADLKLRLAKVAQAMKVAGGLLDTESLPVSADDPGKREAV